MKKKERNLIKECYEQTVTHIMDHKIWDLPLIARKEPIGHVLSILSAKSHVWVVNNMKEKKLVGVITHHDVMSILAPPKKHYQPFNMPKHIHHSTEGEAEDIMIKDPVTCKPDEKVEDALKKMIRHGVRRLAVVQNDVIEGEITMGQIIHKYYKASQFYSIKENP